MAYDQDGDIYFSYARLLSRSHVYTLRRPKAKSWYKMPGEHNIASFLFSSLLEQHFDMML